MPGFHERVLPPWWLYAVVGLIAPAGFIIFLPVAPGWGVAVGLGLWALLVIALVAASPVIEVRGGTLRAGRARIPVSALGEAVTLGRAASKRALGIEFDASAYHLTVPWAGRYVSVPVTDPDDPTSAWVVSTRKGDALVAAIAAARAHEAHQP